MKKELFFSLFLAIILPSISFSQDPYLSVEDQLSMAVLEKPIDVETGEVKKVWCTFHLATTSYPFDDESWIFGPEICLPSTKMLYMESDTLKLSLYGWREVSAMTLAVNNADWSDWDFLRTTIFEKNVETGEIDSFHIEMNINGYSFFSPEPLIEVENDICYSTVTFTEDDYFDDLGENLYMEIKKVGAGVIWSKADMTDGDDYSISTLIDEPGTYSASIIGWKLMPAARDTNKVFFTVSCEEPMMRVIAAPVYQRGIKVVYNNAASVVVYNSSGQEVYRGENDGNIIPIPVPGTYIITTTDKITGISISEKGVVN